MAERKQFSGERGAAFDYLGLGRALLDGLKQGMRMNGLQQLSRTVRLQNGVQVTVSSVFGQDSVMIDAPPELREEVEDQIEEAQRREILLPSETAQPSASQMLGIATSEKVQSPDTVMLIIPRMSIYIGGTCISGPAYWTSDSGLHALSEGGFSTGGKYGRVLALSPDGTIAVGALQIYDPTVNPATINPIDGSGGKPYGYIERIAVWRSGYYNTGSPDIGPWKSGDPSSLAVGTSDDKSYIWVDVGGKGGRWDGTKWGAIQFSGRSADKPPGTTSSDGRVVVSGNKYRLDNGSWIEWGGSDCVGACVVHAAGQPDSLVFSG